MTTAQNPTPDQAGNAPAAAAAPAVPRGQVPQYRLLEPAYIDDIYYDKGQVDAGKAVIYYTGIPGAHMYPLNAAAKEMVRKHDPQRVDPLEKLTIVGPGAEVIAPSRPGG